MVRWYPKNLHIQENREDERDVHYGLREVSSQNEVHGREEHGSPRHE